MYIELTIKQTKYEVQLKVDIKMNRTITWWSCTIKICFYPRPSSNVSVAVISVSFYSCEYKSLSLNQNVFENKAYMLQTYAILQNTGNLLGLCFKIQRWLLAVGKGGDIDLLVEIDRLEIPMKILPDTWYSRYIKKKYFI